MDSGVGVVLNMMVTGLVWLYVFAAGSILPTIADLPTPTAPLPSPTIVPNESSSALAVEAAQQDLAQRLKIPLSSLRLVTAQAKTWQDGCLGLATPEEICIQVLVPGWQLKLTNGQTIWNYRTNQNGTILRVERVEGGE